MFTANGFCLGLCVLRIVSEESHDHIQFDHGQEGEHRTHRVGDGESQHGHIEGTVDVRGSDHQGEKNLEEHRLVEAYGEQGVVHRDPVADQEHYQAHLVATHDPQDAAQGKNQNQQPQVVGEVGGHHVVVEVQVVLQEAQGAD